MILDSQEVSCPSKHLEEDFAVPDKVEGVSLNENSERAMHCVILDRKEITREGRDIENICKLQRCHFLPINHRSELH